MGTDAKEGCVTIGQLSGRSFEPQSSVKGVCEEVWSIKVAVRRFLCLIAAWNTRERQAVSCTGCSWCIPLE